MEVIGSLFVLAISRLLEYVPPLEYTIPPDRFSKPGTAPGEGRSEGKIMIDEGQTTDVN
jgi:hypothetical protein